MKGAALTVNPDLRFVDVSHEVEPQRILEGALILASVFDHFPPGTIFVAVVDPGVGGERRILAAEVAGRALLAPDNGLAAPLLAARGAERLHAVVEARYFRPRVHPTFHGRDVFAPVAAQLARGEPIAALGPRIMDPVRLPQHEPERRSGSLVGHVVFLDRFGNALTNLTSTSIAAAFGEDTSDTSLEVRVLDRRIEGLSRSYGDAPVGTLVAILGSSGRLEIAQVGGAASDRLGIGEGDAVVVRRR
jgi:S-adenosylmethionine hydrolase